MPIDKVMIINTPRGPREPLKEMPGINRHDRDQDLDQGVMSSSRQISDITYQHGPTSVTLQLLNSNLQSPRLKLMEHQSSNSSNQDQITNNPGTKHQTTNVKQAETKSQNKTMQQMSSNTRCCSNKNPETFTTRKGKRHKPSNKETSTLFIQKMKPNNRWKLNHLWSI